jgi:CheY-like chemotaxis protein
VEAHGGTVRAESAGAGRGATFTVRLPVIAVDDGAARAPMVTESATAEIAVSLEHLRVLVVDDDCDNRDMIAASLESHRATVLMAASVPEALDLLRREHIDVVLTDVAMPGEDGYALIRKMRTSSDPAIVSVPVIALTAFARPEDRHHALRAGFEQHLAKPVEAGALASAIASLGKLHVT